MSINVICVPYSLQKGELVHSANSCLGLYITRRLLIYNYDTNSPIVVGKVNKQQFDILTGQAPGYPTGGMEHFDQDDFYWIEYHKMSIQTRYDASISDVTLKTAVVGPSKSPGGNSASSITTSTTTLAKEE